MYQQVQDLQGELETLFGANAPLINLITYEEDRVIRAVKAAAPQLSVYSWDILEYMSVEQEGRQHGKMPERLEKEKLLQFIGRDMPDGTVLILKDFHMAWKDAKMIRGLRTLASKLRPRNKFLIFVTPSEDVPVELRDDVFVMQVPLPDGEELGRVIDGMTQNIDARSKPGREVRHLLINSALGLTTNQAGLAFSRVWAKRAKFDETAIAMVIWEKQRIVRESGALEFTPADAGESDVGGLDLLKNWLRSREKAFSEEARAMNLPFPRGIALIGIPGTGKSLSARMTANLLKLPLLRLDMGSIFGSLLGESEAHMRMATQLAERVSPSILWIDEIEKAFAGAGGGNSGHGAATRVFGTFLTWMQERTAAVFVVATANDISMLPPELMGRFDRTFFLDMPNETERREIFGVHLVRAGLMFPERQLDLNDLVTKTRGYVGREIERIVTEARFTAFSDGNRELEQDDLLKAIKETVPISRSHEEIIEHLRTWKTEGRAFPASSDEVVSSQGDGRRKMI